MTTRFYSTIESEFAVFCFSFYSLLFLSILLYVTKKTSLLLKLPKLGMPLGQIVTFFNILSKKGLLISCLGAVLFCSFFWACGINPKEESSGKVQIQFSTWGDSEEIKVIRGLIQDFEASHPNVSVDLLHIPQNYYQKLHILIAGGLAPDVVFTNSISFPVYARHHVFADLSPYLNESQRLKSDDFYPSSLRVFSLDKAKVTGLGAIPRDLSNIVVYYNADLFKKAGLEQPLATWDWAQFVVLAKGLTKDLDGDGRLDQFGVSFNRHSPLFWMPFVWSAGGHFFNEDMTAVVLDETKALAGLQFYADFQHRHHMAPLRRESGSTKMSELFLQGKLAMLIDGRWRVPSLRKKATFHWDVLPLPKGSAGSITGLDSSGYAMTASTKHPKEAWALIEYLSSPESVSRLAESGLMIPARRDVAESDVFLAPEQFPRHSQVFLDVIETGMPTRSHPRWNELSEEINLALEPVWDGKISPKEALIKIKPKLERILKAVAK